MIMTNGAKVQYRGTTGTILSDNGKKVVIEYQDENGMPRIRTAWKSGIEVLEENIYADIDEEYGL